MVVAVPEPKQCPCYAPLPPPSLASMIATSGLIIWMGLIVVTGSESPVVVVLAVWRLDLRGVILFLHMSKDPIRTGEIVVFNVDGREIPIVHHVIKVHERQESAEVDILTKDIYHMLGGLQLS